MPKHACEPDPEREARSLAAGRAAGYCWDPNPDGPGRCTWPPDHTEGDHKDVYARTEWKQAPGPGADGRRAGHG